MADPEQHTVLPCVCRTVLLSLQFDALTRGKLSSFLLMQPSLYLTHANAPSPYVCVCLAALITVEN
eukprot:13011-Pelagomonas_calceolata.AAC.1